MHIEHYVWSLTSNYKVIENNFDGQRLEVTTEKEETSI